MTNENIAQENGKKEPKWGRLWTLQMCLRHDIVHFMEYAIRAEALKSEYDVERAEDYLGIMEDSILRYREGRSQEFEEAKNEK